MISLREEINFIKAYCYLIEIRHGDNVKVVFDLDEDILDLYIPPISIQLLVDIVSYLRILYLQWRKRQTTFV